MDSNCTGLCYSLNHKNETGLENTSAAAASLESKKNNTVIDSSLMFSFGVIGTVLGLIVLKRKDAEHNRKFFYRLATGLILTDFIGIVATSPVVIAVYVNNFKWIGGKAMCNYFAFMMVFAGMSTMTIVFLMSLERMLSLRFPLQYSTRLRKNQSTFFLLGAWIFAGIIASLPLIGFGEISLQYPRTWCFFNYHSADPVDKGFNYLFALYAILAIFGTVIFNVVVLYTLYRTKMRNISRRNSENSRTFSGNSRRYAECQMVVLLIGTSVVFSTCYLPLVFRILYKQIIQLPETPEVYRVDLLMIRFASMNQILDPWVYILLRREVVASVASTIKSIFSCCSKTSEETEEIDASKYRRQSSSVSMFDQEQQTCCVFCWHCMCDPPTPRRQNSFSFYSEHSRKTRTYSPQTATGRLAVRAAQNGALLTKQLTSNRYSDVTDKLDCYTEYSGSTETISKQPTRVSFHINGRTSKSEPFLCETLIERENQNGYAKDDL